MDTSTGQIFQDTEVEEAIRDGRIKNRDDLVEIPLSLQEDVTKMTRKQRRDWYHQNRKTLNLPRWNELSKLI